MFSIFTRLARTIGLILFIAGGLSWAAEPAGGERKHPERSSDFESTSQVRCLSSLTQVMWQLEKSVQGKDLGSIHNEDAILSMSMKALSTRLDVVPAAQRDLFLTNLTIFARNVSDLHLGGDLGQQAKAESELKKVQNSFE